MKDGRLILYDPNFIDKSNILDNISDEPENYFSQLHMINTIEFKRGIEYMRHFKRIRSERSRKVNRVNEGGLFPYYISDPASCHRSCLQP